MCVCVFGCEEAVGSGFFQRFSVFSEFQISEFHFCESE